MSEPQTVTIGESYSIDETGDPCRLRIARYMQPDVVLEFESPESMQSFARQLLDVVLPRSEMTIEEWVREMNERLLGGQP